MLYRKSERHCVSTIFRNNPKRLGTTSYQEFLLAYEELQKEMKHL